MKNSKENNLDKINNPIPYKTKNLSITMILLFASIEFIFIFQNIIKNTGLTINGMNFTADTATISYINLFSLFIFGITSFFLKNQFKKLIEIFSIIGIITIPLMFFKNINTFTLCYYLNVFLSASISFLITTYFSKNFSQKSIILQGVIGYLFFRIPAEIFSLSFFKIPLSIFIILEIVCYILFLIAMVLQKERISSTTILEVAPDKNEEKTTISNIAIPEQQPPYTIYILIILFLSAISMISNLTSNYIIETSVLNLCFNIGFIVSLIICLITIYKKEIYSFYDLCHLSLYIYIFGLIFMFFNINALKIIGAVLIGLAGLPTLLSVPLIAIVFIKSKNITAPFWILAFNYISMLAFQKILNKISGYDGLVITIIILCIASLIIFINIKNYIKFACIENKINVFSKNNSQNPFSYLSDLELAFVNLSINGYTNNQIIEQLKITPVKFKEMKLCIYTVLNIKTKKELIEKAFNFELKSFNNKNAE